MLGIGSVFMLTAGLVMAKNKAKKVINDKMPSFLKEQAI